MSARGNWKLEWGCLKFLADSLSHSISRSIFYTSAQSRISPSPQWWVNPFVVSWVHKSRAMVYLFCLLRSGQCPPSCVSLSSFWFSRFPKLTKPTNNTSIVFPLLSALMVWLLHGFIFADVNFSVWGSVVCSFLFCLLKFLEILGLFFIIIKF